MSKDSTRWLRAADLAARTGLTERYFQKLFASGRIDWATQPGGPSTPILFEEAGFEAWLASGRKTIPARQIEQRGRATPPMRRVQRGWQDPIPLEQRLREMLAEGSKKSRQ